MYCPRCGSPVTDESCDTCGYWFDAKEALTEPTPGAGVIHNVSELLDLYEDICRKEQLMDGLFLRGEATNTDVLHCDLMRRQSKQAIIEMFIKLLPKEIV